MPSPPSAATARRRPLSSPSHPAVRVPSVQPITRTPALLEAAPVRAVTTAAPELAKPANTQVATGAESSSEPRRHSQPQPRNDEPTIADRANAEKPLGPPQTPLSDALLQGISGGLRAFPEVEWACALSDGSEIALIGVRVDPSFLNRVADITDTILDMGEKHGAMLQVMLLNNQEQVRNARRYGRAFYPWRR
jgi:hypothetical protein